MITINMKQRAHDGADIAEATVDGLAFSTTSNHGAEMGLARQLVAAGVADQPWQTIGADGGVRLRGPSLHGLAGLTVVERDRGGLSIERFTPRADNAARSRGAAPDGAGSPAGTDEPAAPSVPLAA